MRLPLVLSVLAVVGASACASRPEVPDEPEVSVARAEPRPRHPFVKRPSKPKDCAFEVFEAREPERPYVVLGKLPVEANVWLGTRGRKALLRKTACRSGSDAVLLPPPTERTVGDIQVREYTAVFIAFTDGAAPAAPAEAPPSDENVILVPIGEELLGDTDGTQVRPVSPEDDVYWE
ncbi:hypothetical protein ACLESO_42890 [Pyxidicoccus sp. 3LG]